MPQFGSYNSQQQTSVENGGEVKVRAYVRLVAVGLAIAFSSTAAGQPLEGLVFTAHLIDGESSGNASLKVFDLDGDGHKEVLGAVFTENAVVYWESSTGSPSSWTRHIIESGFGDAVSVDAADLDADGDLDVVGAAWGRGEVAWWSNEGGVPIVWTRHSIDADELFPHEVYAADVDNDGDQDVLVASTGRNRISLWYNDGGLPPRWTRQTVNYAPLYQAKSVTAGDIDGDGGVDLVGAALEGSVVRWWRNGGGHPINWEELTIDPDFGGAHRVQAVDLDGDMDLDVVGAGYQDQVAWWRNDGGSPIGWTKQILIENWFNPCIAHAADLDGDGDLDVAASSQFNGEIMWWRNDGGNPINWIGQVLGRIRRVWPLVVADLDDDGDNDLIAGSSFTLDNEVTWFRNEGLMETVRFPIGRVRP